MARSTTLSRDHLKGHLFCYHLEGFTAPNALTTIRNFSGSKLFTLEDVEQLFKNIDDGKYRMNTHRTLLLAEDGVFNERALMEFLAHRYRNTFISNLHSDLLKVTGRELFSMDYVKSLNERIIKSDHMKLAEVRDYNKETLRGFLSCLHIQHRTAVQAHAKLLEITRREVFTLADVEKLYFQISQGEYLIQRHDAKLWKAIPQYNYVKRLVKHADVNTRIALKQTCAGFRDVVIAAPCHINSLNINYIYDTITIRSDPKIAQVKLQMFDREGCAIHSNGKVKYYKNTYPGYHRTMSRVVLSNLALTPNLRITNFNINADLSGVEGTSSLRYDVMNRNVNAENFYLKTDDFRAMETFITYFNAQYLKKFVIFAGNHRYPISTIAEAEQWLQPDVLITNQRFEDIADGTHLAHFKFAIFGLHYVVTIDQVLAIKDTLLLHPELREFKIRCEMLPEQYDDINIRLGTYNARGARVGRWAQFPYAGQANKTLQLCVLEGLAWFKGPEYIPGECDRAEEELRNTENLNEGVFEEMVYSREQV